MKISTRQLKRLATSLSGDLFYDDLLRVLYATDASAYRDLPLAVAYPRTVDDIRLLLRFAAENRTALIPRGAGTSLAGQCVGSGIVVDVSRHLNRILAIDQDRRRVRVEPGVVRDDLNAALKPYGLFFGPNTSTANRCTLGGMVGNNSCGSTSIRYGHTRDKLLGLGGLRYNGQAVWFEGLTPAAFRDKMQLSTHEGALYREVFQRLQPESVRQEIQRGFPKASIHRRNTGYALDALLRSSIFDPEEKEPFNFCKLLAGSEGTLVFTTEIELQLDPLPPPYALMVVAHFDTVQQALEATLTAMKHPLYSCELVDQAILDCTRDVAAFAPHRKFIHGQPAALLFLELRESSPKALEAQLRALRSALSQETATRHLAVLSGLQMEQALALRKAGLGLLSRLSGDQKAVTCIEDTAVALSDLPAYIADFSQLMAAHDQSVVYYGHAAAGELHLRPILNLKQSAGVQAFRAIAEASAQLVKRYDGSLSGEHGDGRLRSEFIPRMVGEANYALFKAIKALFDPLHILNPGKITAAPPMDEKLRYQADRAEPRFETLLDFSDSDGYLGAAERCNGSGDCRKTSSGTLCPSYQATRDERDSTRARANALREFLTQPGEAPPLAHAAVKRVLDFCLSCKACISECPSGVDMAALKAEFTYRYQKQKGIPLRNRLLASSGRLHQLASRAPALANFLFQNPLSAALIKGLSGIAPRRTLPLLQRQSLRTYYENAYQPKPTAQRKVYLFCDEFTDYLDSDLGIDALELLNALGYETKIVEHGQSGRAYLSKGLLEQAQRLARRNVACFAPLITAETPLIGLEPSAILSFRDEYIRLCRAEEKEQAKALARHTFTLEEFLQREWHAGRISRAAFTDRPQRIKIHGHCHQKALSTVQATFEVLNIPENYTPTIIPSGCCGMAGSFGYEKEHYALSMRIGELRLFPAIRDTDQNTLLAAPGTSCRQQIWDGTGREALHPASILRRALQPS